MSWTSPLTALPHLSDEAVAAFADGVLSDTARQRAQSHMAGCAECSDAVYGQRAARAALRSAGWPTLPDGLFERLRELPITTELPSVTMASALSADGQPLFAAFTAPIAELSMVTSSAPARPRPSALLERPALPQAQPGQGQVHQTRSAVTQPYQQQARHQQSPQPPARTTQIQQHPADQLLTDQLLADQLLAHQLLADQLLADRHLDQQMPDQLLAGARPTQPAPAAERPLVLTGHRHTSTRIGLGATAAAVLAVGVLVTTAANAGGITPTTRVVQSSVTDRPGSSTPMVPAPMQMTLLSVPSSGR